MTKEEFEQQYARNSGYSLEKLKKLGMHAVECACGFDVCEGWNMESQPQPAPCLECAKKKKTVTAASYRKLKGPR